MSTTTILEPGDSDHWGQRILETGQRLLVGLEPLVHAADPSQTVSPANRMLCAGLAELARASAGELFAIEAQLEAAAILALVTKIDDQIIDAPAFHQDRTDLEYRLRRYLSPTLTAILSPHKADLSPRAQLAARLGHLLAQFPIDRQEPLRECIVYGWETQVQAVLWLTEHPRNVDPDHIERLTTQISTDWLKMISLCGTLSADTLAFDEAEIMDFTRWGHVIQRADCLTDLAKDHADGHLSALPSLYWYQADPTHWGQGSAALQAALERFQIAERLALPPLVGSFSRHRSLAELLAWIQRFLLGRAR